jgi:hypothetical protein
MLSSAEKLNPAGGIGKNGVLVNKPTWTYTRTDDIKRKGILQYDMECCLSGLKMKNGLRNKY